SANPPGSRRGRFRRTVPCRLLPGVSGGGLRGKDFLEVTWRWHVGHRWNGGDGWNDRRRRHVGLRWNAGDWRHLERRRDVRQWGDDLHEWWRRRLCPEWWLAWWLEWW